MLFWIFVGIFILGILGLIGCKLYYIIQKKRKPNVWHLDWFAPDWIANTSWGFLIVGLVANVVMGLCILGVNADAPAQKAQLEQRYNGLVYKIETEAIRDEFGLVTHEFVTEAQQWNEEIAYGKTIKENIWIGIFIPDIYNDFELIDLNSVMQYEVK